jgi:hypothetical protein
MVYCLAERDEHTITGPLEITVCCFSIYIPDLILSLKKRYAICILALELCQEVFHCSSYVPILFSDIFAP